METIPIVDYADILHGNKQKFLKDLHFALSEIGFMVLVNYPGLEDSFQKKMFKKVRQFFNAPKEVKQTADIRNNPYFRGWSKKVGGNNGFGQVIEAFQYAFESEPICEPDDENVHVYKRLFRGPNAWPDTKFDGMEDFRDSIHELTGVYHKLTHDLGHLICECLGEDPSEFDKYFDFKDPDLAASLNHNFSMHDIPEEKRPKILKEFKKAKSNITGAHIDGPPFVALLINDRPGLEVVTTQGNWIAAPVTCQTVNYGVNYPVPIIPNSVIVNSGGTLMHLSKGRIGATLHRVNTSLIPYGEDRVSMPFFLLPKMDGPLIPFGMTYEEARQRQKEGHTGYELDRDRGTNAAVNRMGTFPQTTKRWWKKEFKLLRRQHLKEVAAETQAAYDLANARGKKARL
eukprot:g14362.t1